MDRNEWGNMVGDNADVVDDLRWSLFKAERAITSIIADQERPGSIRDPKLLEAYHKQAWDARCALAALWTRAE